MVHGDVDDREDPMEVDQRMDWYIYEMEVESATVDAVTSQHQVVVANAGQLVQHGADVVKAALEREMAVVVDTSYLTYAAWEWPRPQV